MSRGGKALVVLVCVVLAGVVVILVRGGQVERYRDNKVAGGEITRAWDVLAVHRSRPQYLKIGEKTYRGVRGLPPYYLDLPSLNSILFVTQEADYHVTFHVFNLGTKNDIQIDGGTSGLGWGIGGSRKPGGKFTDSVEAADSNHVTVVIRSGDWTETMLLNLTTKVIERRETVHFDEQGHVTKRSVQP